MVSDSVKGKRVKRSGIDPKPMWEEKWRHDLVDITHKPHDHHIQHEVTVHNTSDSSGVDAQPSFNQSIFDCKQTSRPREAGVPPRRA